MPNYPAQVASLSTFNRWTGVSVGWVSKVHSEIGAIQTDYASTLGDFSTLSSRIAVLRASDGTWKTTGLSHGIFTATSGNHHVENHATAHKTGGADAFPVASVASRGLLSQTLFSKLANIVTNATENAMRTGTYIGSGAADAVGQLVSTGIEARRIFITIDDDATLHRAFRYVAGTSPTAFTCIAEIASSASGHFATDIVFAVGTGIRVNGLANISTINYRYITWGQKTLP